MTTEELKNKLKELPNDLELMLMEEFHAAAHGRKIKDIAISPYSENCEMKVAIMFDAEDDATRRK